MKENKGSVIVGQLRVMSSDTTNDTYKQYIDDAVELILTKDNDSEILAEVGAALDMMSYKYSRIDAEALRDAAEYLKGLYVGEIYEEEKNGGMQI